MSQESAPNAPEPTPRQPERLAKLRKELAKLARWGVMASALSGILPRELAAQENDAAWQARNSARLEQLEVANRRVSIQKQVGQEKYAMLLNPSGPTSLQERPKDAAAPLVGFEKLPETAAAIRAVLAMFPASFVRQVPEIRHENLLLATPAEYSMAVGTVEAAHVSWSDSRITFTAGSNSLRPAIIAKVLEHELCHVGDPSRNKDMRETDRIWFYYEVLGRSQAPDRFHSAYVEQIQNTDTQMQTRNRGTEYWAEACGAYLRGDPLLPDEDRALVSAVLQKTDPTLNEESLTSARTALDATLEKLNRRHAVKQSLKPIRR